MARETVISAQVIIESPAQVCHFQMKIPRSVNRITGIETGIVLTSGELPPQNPGPGWNLPLHYVGKTMIGELKLKTLESANIFYTHELTVDPNIRQADFAGQYFRPRVYTHQKQTHEDPISLDGNVTIIQGIYRNMILLDPPYSYTVQVYVWMEAKEQN